MTRNLETQPSGLYIQTPNQQAIAFPLKHTEVKAKVSGNISRVEVTQTFENPFTTTLEATYIFPLPDEAAVDDMLIRIGDRTIQGSIKKRQEAQQIYEQAKRQGRTAGLLEQERDNIFTQSLANIKPGEQIDVIIRYTESLKFEGGNYEFVFPMVVGPRYIPGITIEENTAGGGSALAPMSLNQDTDLVPDASRLNAPILPNGMRSRHDINVTIEINAGVEIQNINSPSHHIQITRNGQIVQVKLADGDTIPNKDLIIRYQIGSKKTQAALHIQADERGGHFAVYLIPALEYRPDQLVPKDVIFLIDTSGSQSGAPLIQCQELMRRFINGLNPQDTFSIIDFADTTQQLSAVPLFNTPQNRRLALNYINRLNAGGGTEMLKGIRTVLNFPVTEFNRLRTIVLLTDGYIGNENRILAAVQQHLQPGTRLHSFGAGSSVNRFLLNRIAEIGRGIAHIIRHDEPVNEVVEKFYRQINNPVFTNIKLQWEGDGESPIIYPLTPPDLFAEQPLVLFGNKSDRLAGKLHITGITADGKHHQQTFNINFTVTGNPGIAQLWGRSRIKDLMNQMVSGDTKAGVEAVTNTVLTYQLLSQYTAFIAVSDEVRVNPLEDSLSLQVPVEMPEGISHQRKIIGSAALIGRRPSLSRPQPPMYAPAPGLESLPDDFANLGALLSKPEPSVISEPLSDAELTDFLADFTALNNEDSDPNEIKGRGYPVPLSLKPVDQNNPRLKIVNITGITQSMISLITDYLQTIPLPEGVSGELVFEFEYHHGRVKNVALDEDNSTIQEWQTIDIIFRKLYTWKCSEKFIGQVVLKIQIQP
ncbi:after-VIT domain-containing protein [Anabaena sphaerica FACHB-251]|uniref:After-VIT domain-containing protein n=1 Tax=Anabaena sphaerica FACHB-251 TaxID=2692883 RepID=A0A926WJY1_9NOST|nr:VIT domain-containing protein [Anabaena sphaerica]MBD2295878.1 after-VIT domain-containing protein [Anabaena sphaerica FACHB-251]